MQMAAVVIVRDGSNGEGGIIGSGGSGYILL